MLAAKSQKPAAISSMCAVFAETEIIGLLASGVLREDIAAGVQASVAARVASMEGRNLNPPIVFTGGVAMIPGMREAIEAALGQPVSVAPSPQMTGALGAALMACRQMGEGQTC
jgi:activator of 2-hydroxyglutaryl-CoA dehydratase